MTAPPTRPFSLFVDFSHQLKSPLFAWMAFSPVHLQVFHAALGPLLNIEFLRQAFQCSLGQRGEVFQVEATKRKAVDYNTCLGDVTGRTCFVFEFDTPPDFIEHTLVPDFGITRSPWDFNSTSNSSSGFSSTQSTSPLRFSRSECGENGLLMGDFDLSTLDRRPVRTLEDLMARKVFKRDARDRLTGTPADFCQNAHLVEATTPSENFIHILESRKALFPTVDISSFTRGVHDPRVGIPLSREMHTALDNNRMTFYLVPPNPGDAKRIVHALPLDRDCQNLLRSRAYDDGALAAGPFIRVLGQGFEVDLSANDEVIEAAWSWAFGARMLARFASSQAKELTERSPLVQGVLLWREKLTTFKQTS